MQIVRETAMLHFGGSAGQQRVSSSFLEKFNLPLPPLTKQQEIADHISAIRAEAKVLEQEANAILEQAKKKVEEMILG
jgi:type I restriction enzyme S subunit